MSRAFSKVLGGKGKHKHDDGGTLKRLEEDRSYLKTITKGLSREIDSLEVTSQQGRFLSNTLVDVSRIDDSNLAKCFDVFAKIQTDLSDLTTSWCGFARHNLLDSLSANTTFLKPMQTSETTELIIERVRAQTIEEIVAYVTAYERYVGELGNALNEHLPSLTKIREKASADKDKVIENLKIMLERTPPQPRAVTKFKRKSERKPKNRGHLEQKKKGAGLGVITESEQTVARTDIPPPLSPTTNSTSFLYADSEATSSTAGLPLPLIPLPAIPVDPVFGVDLTELVGRDGVEAERGLRVPVVVFEIVAALNHTGLTHTGLFRIAGNRRRVKELKHTIDNGTFPLLPNCFMEEKPHELCALLKLYLRELPQSLFTFRLTEEWLDAAWQEEEDQPALYKSLVSKLPEANAVLLDFVIRFLRSVSAMSSSNEMDNANLASMIAPNVLYREVPDPEKLVEEAEAANWVLEMLLVHFPIIFVSVNSEDTQPSPPVTPLLSPTKLAESTPVQETQTETELEGVEERGAEATEKEEMMNDPEGALSDGEEEGPSGTTTPVTGGASDEGEAYNGSAGRGGGSRGGSERGEEGGSSPSVLRRSSSMPPVPQTPKEKPVSLSVSEKKKKKRRSRMPTHRREKSHTSSPEKSKGEKKTKRRKDKEGKKKSRSVSVSIHPDSTIPNTSTTTTTAITTHRSSLTTTPESIDAASKASILSTSTPIVSFSDKEKQGGGGEAEERDKGGKGGDASIVSQKLHSRSRSSPMASHSVSRKDRSDHDDVDHEIAVEDSESESLEEAVEGEEAGVAGGVEGGAVGGGGAAEDASDAVAKKSGEEAPSSTDLVEAEERGVGAIEDSETSRSEGSGKHTPRFGGGFVHCDYCKKKLYPLEMTGFQQKKFHTDRCLSLYQKETLGVLGTGFIYSPRGISSPSSLRAKTPVSDGEQTGVRLVADRPQHSETEAAEGGGEGGGEEGEGSVDESDLSLFSQRLHIFQSLNSASELERIEPAQAHEDEDDDDDEGLDALSPAARAALRELELQITTVSQQLEDLMTKKKSLNMVATQRRSFNDGSVSQRPRRRTTPPALTSLAHVPPPSSSTPAGAHSSIPAPSLDAKVVSASGALERDRNNSGSLLDSVVRRDTRIRSHGHQPSSGVVRVTSKDPFAFWAKFDGSSKKSVSRGKVTVSSGGQEEEKKVKEVGEKKEKETENETEHEKEKEAEQDKGQKGEGKSDEVKEKEEGGEEGEK